MGGSRRLSLDADGPTGSAVGPSLFPRVTMLPEDPTLTTSGIHDICGASYAFEGLQRWPSSLFGSPLLHLPLLPRHSAASLVEGWQRA